MIDQYASLSEKFLRKGFWLYLFSFIIAPMGYIIKVIISGELSVSEVGVLYGIISLITLISAYNDLGVTESLNHFIPEFITHKRYDKIKSILLFSLIVQMVTGISIAGIFYFGADFLADYYFKTDAAIGTLKIFAFFFLGINIFQIISTFFIAIQNTFYNKIIDFVRMSFILIFVLWVLFSGNSSLENFSYAWVVGLYIGVILAIVIFIKKFFLVYFKTEKILWEKKLILSIGKYSIFVFLGTQAGVVLSQLDMQMIIYFLGTQDAGYYTNYLSIISIPFMVITPIFALLFPIFSEFHSKKEYNMIYTIKNMLGKNLMSIAIAFNILFFVFAESIAYILFGEKFITSGNILRYSILFLVFNFLLQINFNILAGIGRVGKRVQIITIGIIINFFMNILFIHLLGVYGAALATAIGWFVIWILSEISLGKEYAMNFNIKLILKNICIFSVIGGLTSFYILPFTKDFERILMLGTLFIYSFIYFGIFFFINKKDFSFFIIEIKKLKGKK